MNRVIDGVDLDGLEWTAKHFDETRNGNKKRVTYFSVEIKVINNSTMLDEKALDNYVENLQKMIASTFSGYDDAKKREYKTLEKNINITIAPDNIPRQNNGIIIELTDEMIFEVYDDKTGERVEYTGYTRAQNTQNSHVNVILNNNDAFLNTSIHELGHTAGLSHIWVAMAKGIDGVSIISKGAPKDIYDMNEEVSLEDPSQKFDLIINGNGYPEFVEKFEPSQKKLKVLNNAMNSPGNPHFLNAPDIYKKDGFVRKLELTISQLQQMTKTISAQDKD